MILLSRRASTIFIATLATVLLSGCGTSDSPEENVSVNLEHVDIVASKRYAQSFTYILKLKSDINEAPEKELKSMSQSLTQRTINQNSLTNPNIAIYIFDSDQVVPDISGHFSGHFDITDHIYEGDHGKWSYIYMHPLMGEPTWASCNGSESDFCR